MEALVAKGRWVVRNKDCAVSRALSLTSTRSVFVSQMNDYLIRPATSNSMLAEVRTPLSH